MPLTFACAVCGWKYDPADFPARERPETFVPHHHGPRAALCLGGGGIALPVQARESEVCAMCGGPADEDGQRTADAIICGPCLSKHARPIPSRSVYTRESVAPPELGGEAG